MDYEISRNSHEIFILNYLKLTLKSSISTKLHSKNGKQGLKRSVTTLRGGSLGYAEIVAVKVESLFKKTLAQYLCL